MSSSLSVPLDGRNNNDEEKNNRSTLLLSSSGSVTTKNPLSTTTTTTTMMTKANSSNKTTTTLGTSSAAKTEAKMDGIMEQHHGNRPDNNNNNINKDDDDEQQDTSNQSSNQGIAVATTMMQERLVETEDVATHTQLSLSNLQSWCHCKFQSHIWDHPQRRTPFLGLLGVVLVFCTTTTIGHWILYQGLLFVLRVLAWAIGISFGLGWSAHVYERLDLWQARQDEQELLLLSTSSTTLATSRGGFLQQQQQQPPHSGITTTDDPLSLSDSHHRRHMMTMTDSRSTSFGGGGEGGGVPRLSAASAGSSSDAPVSQNRPRAPTLQDEQTYLSLMQAAGYHIPTSSSSTNAPLVLRGQVLRRHSSNSSSNTTGGTNDRYRMEQGTRALESMLEMWGPQSPHPRIQAALSQWMEYLVRDFVASWYSSVDKGVAYQRPTPAAAAASSLATTTTKTTVAASTTTSTMAVASTTYTANNNTTNQQKRDEGNGNDKSSSNVTTITTTSTSSNNNNNNNNAASLDGEARHSSHSRSSSNHSRSSNNAGEDIVTDEEEYDDKNHNKDEDADPSSSSSPSFVRSMIYSTSRQSPIPFLDHLYTSLATVLGNLAMRVETVNVLELVLMKWTRILAHTFRVYRQLRRRLVQHQQQQEEEQQHHRTTSSSSNTPASTTTTTTTATKTTSEPSPMANTTTTTGGSTSKLATASTTTTTTTTTPSSPSSQLDGAQSTTTASVSNVSSTSSGTRPVPRPPLPPPPTRRRRQSRIVTEIAMTREFLLAGKLHRAITFGVDIPSLLFGDTSGRECGVHVDTPSLLTLAQQQAVASRQSRGSTGNGGDDDDDGDDDTARMMTADEVLERRLFETPLLRECELDYNRVLAHRMIKALSSRTDSSSPLISSLLTEIFASCILTPVMGLFGPDCMNGWILQGLSKKPPTAPPKKPEGNPTTTTPTKTKKTTTTTGEDSGRRRKLALRKRGDTKSTLNSPQKAVTSSSSSSGPLSSPSTRGVGGEAAGGVESLSLTVVQEGMEVEWESGTIATTTTTTAVRTASVGDEDFEDDEDVVDLEEDDDYDDEILSALSESLLEMQQFMDFDQLRARLSPQSSSTFRTVGVDTVEWDDPDCRAAVLRLVLIIEAAMSDGRCVRRKKPPRPPPPAATTPSSSNKPLNKDDMEEEKEQAKESMQDGEAKESIQDGVNKTEDAAVAKGETKDDGKNEASGSLRTMMTTQDSTVLDEMDGDVMVDDALTDDPTLLSSDFREETTTLPQLLMEMTGDVDAFEERVATENSVVMAKESADVYEDDQIEEKLYPQPNGAEQSTLRTLIAAWLHTGQIHRIMTLIVQAHATVLTPHYRKTAFLRSLAKTSRFIRELQVLDQVDILVDTMEVLASPPLEIVPESKPPTKGAQSPLRPSPQADEDELNQSPTPQVKVESKEEDQSQVALLVQERQQTMQSTSSLSSSSQLLLSSATVPRYFDFHRNDAFAASLRSERERRMQSWYAGADQNEPYQSVSSKSLAEESIMMLVSRTTRNEMETQRHRELHQIARIFYNSTNLITIRDAARRKNASSTTETNQQPAGSVAEQQPGDDSSMKQERPEKESAEEELSWVSLLTVETACPRRRIEVPDDDSSFLLRAQPRPLHAVGVHRDQRNHDQSFKCFAASYEEPALGSDHYSGGRYIRMCLVRYYPIDRTAAIFPPQQQDGRNRMDQRRSVTSTVPELITLDSSSTTSNRTQTPPFLSSDFLRERHICHRWVPKGTSRTHSMLASNVMEPSDFTAQPRTGKAMDFVFRMSLFEKPMIELRSKKFTVYDSSSALGTHRADSSSMEISDAALSTALCLLDDSKTPEGEGASSSVQMGDDGYPIVWMKFSKQGNDSQVEVKRFRLSFVRASLLITSARQEAQLQSLISCVKLGSAKNATKALTDARLKPTLRLLYHASHKSREKQSLLLRDLKLGINHIDRDQLRRNGLLNPRYPTSIKDLSVSVEDALQAEEVHDANLFGTTGTVYKIKCMATVQLIHDYNDPVDEECYGKQTRTFCEEWVVYRSFKEFQALHKHLKNVVSTSESSGNAVTRLSASLHGAANPSSVIKRQRSALVPSLSQASKIGTLGLTKKSMQKRREHLEGYLSHLFAPGHLLSRCPELLLFVGAFYPLPPAVKLDVCVTGLPDPLGRTRMKRTEVEEEVPISEKRARDGTTAPGAAVATRSGGDGDEAVGEDSAETKLRKTRKKTSIQMIPAIRHKVDKVPLSQVRNRVFELLRYQFGFDNASFMRSRMLAGLKTASFAITSASEFRRTLYNWHIKNLSTSAVAGWIDFGRGLLWPNGVFFQGNPPLTPEQLADQAKKCQAALHSAFPDALRAILGQELTRDGLNIVHEMLQNRVVVRSMAYMLFDILWLEVFPEIGDVLEGGAALDIDK